MANFPGELTFCDLKLLFFFRSRCLSRRPKKSLDCKNALFDLDTIVCTLYYTEDNRGGLSHKLLALVYVLVTCLKIKNKQWR